MWRIILTLKTWVTLVSGYKTVTFDDNTNKVTFKNLEVLCQHLEKRELLYQGKPRRVILSEQGFHTLLTPEGEKLTGGPLPPMPGRSAAACR